MALKDSWDREQDPLAALQAGRPGPFEAFVRSETGTLLAFFLRLGAPRSEAEDLVQEALLKLYQHADSYQPQGRFTSFVLRVARNAWIDRLRRLSLRREHEAGAPRRSGSGAGSAGETPGAGSAVDWAESREVDPALQAGRREEVVRLRRAWNRLPEHHRMVFELGVLQQRSYQEISEVLGVPVGTVKSRMFYALQKLRGTSAVEAAEGNR